MRGLSSVVLVLALGTGLALVVVSFPGTGVTDGSTPPAVGNRSPALISPLNTTDCSLVGNQSGTVAAIGWPSSFANDITSMFAKLCVDPVFVQQVSEWGGWRFVPPVTANGTTTPGFWWPGNFTEQYGGAGPPCPCSNSTSFNLQYLAGSNASHPPGNVTGNCTGLCGWVETWYGFLPGDNYTGPNFVRGYPPVCTGCPGPIRAPPFPWGGPLALVFWSGLVSVVAVVVVLVVVLRRPPPPQASRPSSPVPPSPGPDSYSGPETRAPEHPP